MITARTFNRYSAHAAMNPVAARHRGFLEKLSRAQRSAARIAPIARVLRRATDARLYQTSLAMHFMLRLTRRIAVLNRHEINPIAHRSEVRTFRADTVMRLIERQRSLESRVIEHRTQQFQSKIQTVNRERIERQMAFPTVPMTTSKPQAAITPAVVRPDARELQSNIVRRAAREMDPVRSAERVSPVTLPEQELSRVTDHVIKQLDRRIVSYRERAGLI